MIDGMREKIYIVIWSIIFLLLCGGACYCLFVQASLYYTQIDNTRILELGDSDMKYQYSLDCYSKSGKKKEITFKTSRKLKEDAFLELEYLNISGVHSWREVSYEELPKEVQKEYRKP